MKRQTMQKKGTIENKIMTFLSFIIYYNELFVIKIFSSKIGFRAKFLSFLEYSAQDWNDCEENFYF